MKEYNEVMRISWENGEEKWGFTPRQDEEEIEKLRQQNAELEKENEFLKEENFSLMLKISRQKSPEVKAKIIAKSLGIKTTGGE